MAIQLERNGEAVYRRAVRSVSRPALASLLEWMADEEIKHAAIFSDMKKNVAASPQNPIGEEMSREVFNDILGKQTFSLQDTDFSRIKRIDDLISIFIEFEKDTVLFYDMLKPFLEDKETLAQMKKIIAEENAHIDRLQELLEAETQAT
jgi:rubrerythrin